MPYESKAQQRWAHTESGLKKLGGAAKVHEWDEATKAQLGGFKALPAHVGKAKPKARKWGALSG